MSVIQNIRDKYARWAVIAIALSLLGFILMDAFAGRGKMFGNRSTTVGKINGYKIDINDFNRKVQMYQAQAQSQSQNNGEGSMQQAVEGAWRSEVDSVLLAEQYDQLGLSVSQNELNDILFGTNPPQDLRQRFADSATGAYNANEARQFINNIKKTGSPENKEQLYSYFESLQAERMMSKYYALFTNSIYYPKWYLEKRNTDNAMISKVSMVTVPYTTISDSTVKVTDDEINDYVNDHKSLFEQKDETRSISYVQFSAKPSAADSAAARTELEKLKPAFDTTKDMATFVQRYGTMPFYNGYINKNDIQQPNKEAILSAPVGTVYGPFVDAGNQGQNAQFVMSKIIGVQQIPDTVKVRHILISTVQQNPQTGQAMMVRDDSSAKRLADSVLNLFRSGQSFDTLVAKFSEDPGSKSTGGVYDNVTSGRMVAPFNDYIFTHATGETGLVKTDYGYHIVNIISQKGSAPGYKVAYLSKPIVTSPETESVANNEANLFAGDSRDLKAFNDNYEKKLRTMGINKLMANDITPMAYQIQGINGTSRKFIKDIFDADKGDVVGPEKVGEDYVVAVVTEVNKPGVQSASRARVVVEPVLRNKKKAEMIKKNIGTPASLEQVAQKTAQQVQTLDSVSFSGGSALGYETKVLGAAFNAALKGKVSEPIAGQQGVYVLRVENISTKPVENANIEEQRKMLEQQARQMMGSQMQYGQNPLLDPLKKAAKIQDNRASFY